MTPEEILKRAQKMKDGPIAGSRTETLTPEAPAPVVEPKEEKSTQNLLAESLIGILPALVGYGIGGASGGEAGAKAGLTGLGKIEEGRKTEAAAALKKSEMDRDDKWKKETADQHKATLAETERNNKENRSIEWAKLQNDKAKKTAEGAKGSSKEEDDIRNEWMKLPVTKATQDVSVSYAKMQKASSANTPAGDMTMIYGFMKMNDPGSTVREGEYATAQNAAGIPDRVRNAYNAALKGTKLDPAQREDFLTQAGNLYQAQLESQEATDKGYREIATRRGYNPDNIFINFGQKTSKEVGNQQGGQQLAKSKGTIGIPGVTSSFASGTKPKSVIQNGQTFTLNEKTGEYE